MRLTKHFKKQVSRLELNIPNKQRKGQYIQSIRALF